MSMVKYDMIGDWSYAANGCYGFCRYEGREMFIKRLHDPKYPARKSDFLPETYERMVARCKEFEKDRERIHSDLRDCEKESPSIVPPRVFFRDGDSYMVISDKIDVRYEVKNDDICRLPYEEIHDIMLQYAQGLKALAAKGIVHGDLKPSNVFIVKEGGRHLVKLIDFDDSYYSGNPPDPESTVGSPEYYSPELNEYIAYEDPDRRDIVTCKNDVFAMGLMFHQYLTGAKVSNTVGKYPAQIDTDEDLQLSPKLSEADANMIRAMLRIDREERISAEQVAAILNGESIPGGGPSITEQPDGSYIYIDSRGKKRTVDASMATTLSRINGIEITRFEKPETSPGEGPKLIAQSDGSYLYIDEFNKKRIVDRSTATMLSKIKGIPMGDEASGTEEGDEETAVPEPEGPKLIAQSDGSYLYIGGDGSKRIVDAKTAETLSRIKGIPMPDPSVG